MLACSLPAKPSNTTRPLLARMGEGPWTLRSAQTCERNPRSGKDDQQQADQSGGDADQQDISNSEGCVEYPNSRQRAVGTLLQTARIRAGSKTETGWVDPARAGQRPAQSFSRIAQYGQRMAANGTLSLLAPVALRSCGRLPANPADGKASNGKDQRRHGDGTHVLKYRVPSAWAASLI